MPGKEDAPMRVVQGAASIGRVSKGAGRLDAAAAARVSDETGAAPGKIRAAEGGRRAELIG